MVAAAEKEGGEEEGQQGVQEEEEEAGSAVPVSVIFKGLTEISFRTTTQQDKEE